jgi:hypothetical protein
MKYGKKRVRQSEARCWKLFHMARVDRFVMKSRAQVHESVFSGFTEGDEDSEINIIRK